MFCTSCGSPINDGIKFCSKCGTQVKTVPSVSGGTRGINSPSNEYAQAANQKTGVFSKKGLITGIVAVVAAVVMGITIFSFVNAYNNNVPAQTNVNVFENTAWKCTDSHFFGLSTEEITIEFSATKFNLISGGKAERGSYTISDDDTVILKFDSEYSSILMSDEDLVNIGIGVAGSIWGKVKSVFSDVPAAEETAADEAGSENISEPITYTGLLIGKTLTINDKVFKRK